MADSTPVGPVVAACGTANTIAGCGYDSDGDGISDSIEGRGAGPGGTDVDTDGDGTPDYLDCDSDNDTVPDAVEWITQGCDATGLNDADGDGVPNFRDTDSDGNGLGDKDEVCPPAAALTKLGMAACTTASGGVYPYDFDGDGYPDFIDPDNDHDSISTTLTVGLEDSYELTDFSGTYVGAIDTDGDGIPDVWDRDSDNDFIVDQSDGLGDFDKDGVQNFRDTDSDGDGVPDRFEGHTTLANASPRSAAVPASVDDSVALLSQAPVDNDGDGAPDFLDLDSDNDFLPDGQEDKNADGYVESTETDRINADTDGDGAGDLIEVSLEPAGANWANDPTKTPHNQGLFYFVVPYSTDGSAAPSPGPTPLAMQTTLNQADVAFVIDTTTSMDSVMAAVGTSIADTLIPDLAGKITDLELGVIGYDDALAEPFGGDAARYSGTTLTHNADRFVWFPNGLTTGSQMGTSTNAIKAATTLGATKTSISGDYPEGTTLALWWALTGEGFSFVSDADGTTVDFAGDTTIPSGHVGGMHFRNSALPIVINTTDANFHNGKTTGCGALDASGICQIAYNDDTAISSSLGYTPAIDDVVDRFNAIGAKYIGVSIHGGDTVCYGSSLCETTQIERTDTNYDYYGSTIDMEYLARMTGSKVPFAALGGTASDCKTENSASTTKNAADADGTCPLVFDVEYSGTGLGTIIASGVLGLLDAIRYDVHVVATPTLVGSIDPVNAFMQNIVPLPTGGTDPTTGTACVTFPAAQTADHFTGPKATAGADGTNETITQVNPGPLYCFAVSAKPNVTVPATSAVQIFYATLRVYAERPAPLTGTITLGADRTVLFVVPPVIN